MFFRLYRYGMLQSTRQRMLMFWNLIFPVILGTMFQLVFGNFVDETVAFHQIPVAYVEGEGADTSFPELLQTLEEENGLLEVMTVGKEEAKELLQKGQAAGIYYNGTGTLTEESSQALEKISLTEGNGQALEKISLTEENVQASGKISLTVTEQEISQSILSEVLEQYERTAGTFANIGQEHPEGLARAAAVLEEECQYLKTGGISDSPQNAVMDFFYALIAMNCLMGAVTGMMSAINFKANLSDLAARRVAAGTSRFAVLLAELAAKLTVQFFCTVFSVCYLVYVLQVSIGNKLGWILLTVFMGDMVGIFLGFFIGALGRLPERAKESLCVTVTLVSSFLSGLMVPSMYRIVETKAPVVHRINPASLIVKALYSLDIYDSPERYAQCMGSLLILAVLLGAGIFLSVRRERYASV